MKKNHQFDLVNQFFKQVRDVEGLGVNEYFTHTDFKAGFKNQLIRYLRHLRDIPLRKPVISSKSAFTGIPYRGLTALDEADASIFFGRQTETLELLSRVERKPLVMVLGPSGSGKSSLIAAGVLPELRKRGWGIVRCVPGEDPFYSLALAMVSQLPELGVQGTNYLPEARKLADILRQQPENVAQQLTSTLPQQRILLFIDQFEEVFAKADKNPGLKHGTVDEIDVFLQAVQHYESRLTKLMTMRADFYEIDMPRFEALKREPYVLTRPSVYALHELITRPAELSGLQLDPGLAQQIIEDVGNTGGALALIAYLMQSLYLPAQARGDSRLSLEDYKVLGGVQGAIDTLANQAFSELQLDEAAKKAAMQSVFRELIELTKKEDNQIVFTRRRARLSSFAPESAESRLIDAFTDARLLVKDSECVEIVHEYLFRSWNWLSAWIERNKEDWVLLNNVQRRAEEWKRNNRPDWMLPRQQELVEIKKAIERQGKPDDLPDEFIESEVKRLIDRLRKPELDENEIGYVFTAVKEIGPVTIPDLLIQFKDTNDLIRKHVAYILGLIKGELALNALIHDLDDSDIEVQFSVIHALGQFKHPDAIDALVRTLANPDPIIKRRVAEALKVSGELASKTLINIFVQGDPSLRILFAEMLGDIKDDLAVKPLSEALKNDEDPIVRSKAAIALGNFTNEHAIAALFNASETDEDHYVQRLAAKALNSLVFVCLSQLASDDINIRKKAVLSLVRIGESAVIPLIEALNHNDNRIRSSALAALMKINTPEAQQAVSAYIFTERPADQLEVLD